MGDPEEKGYTAGGAFASLCAQYLIIGFICCVGIYFMRVKSILLQIVCFILGFIILSLIWVRVVTHFMF